MSTRDLINGETADEEYIDNSERVSDHSYNLLKLEYETCRQEIYNLKRKLQLNEAMLREVQEANELLERTLEQQASEKEIIISEIEKKHRILTKDYENIIANFETELTRQTKEIEALRLQRAVDPCVETEHVVIANQFANLSFEADTLLKIRIDQLLTSLTDEKNKYERAEQTIEELKSRCDELEHYSRNTKQQLDEKNQALEDARAELILVRAEAAASLEIEPTRETCKGNSLFAEVEDRRQDTVTKMNVLRDKYAEIKRVCKSQMAEMKMLRAERAATLRKWENDVDHTLMENEQLIQKYKNRISDLENKLKSEIKKNDDSKQFKCTDASFRYFQSLLDAKRKETDKLRVQVEDLCTKLLVEEEAKIIITKQLQYWRNKASSFEAQVCVAQDLIDDAEHKMIKEPNDFTRNDATTTIRENQSILKQRSENSARSILSNCSPKTKNTRAINSPEDCKLYNQSTNKQKNSPDFARERNTDNKENRCSTKFLRFTENITITEKTSDDFKKSSAMDCKYPVLFISNDVDD
ncbi:hypothetical protein ANTRET_LOCUS6270 [Anthophora retusa]